MLNATFPLVPSSPDKGLHVLIIGRISTEHQDLENIEASYRYVEDHLRRSYHGPMRIKHLGERASGMLVDRATIREAEDLIASGAWDVVIAEDLSRIFRNPRHQYNFVQDAVDSGTRLIAIADNLDTADPNWELMLGAATLRHGLLVSDTRRRVRRTATHSFHRGGMVMKVKYGYRKLTAEEAQSGHFGRPGLMIAKRPECTAIIRQMMDRILNGASYAAVRDWLIDEGIEAPPYSRREGWSGHRVKDLLTDPILCGQRTFRKTLFEPIYKTGKHKRLKNEQPETELYPELAHITSDEHQIILNVIRQREQSHCHQAGSSHPLTGRPRSRAIWPAQHAHCGVCGGLMYRYDRDTLKCQNAHSRGARRCWNHVQVPCELARQRIVGWLLKQFEKQPEFRTELLDAAFAECNFTQQRISARHGSRGKQIAELERQASNLAGAIAQGGRLDALLERLQEVNRLLAAARQDQANASDESEQQMVSAHDIAQRIDVLISNVTRTSFEFGDLIRKSISALVILPVQAIDSGLVRPRARLTLATSFYDASAASVQTGEVEDGISVTLDLFERPLHLRHLAACVEARQKNPDLGLKEIGRRLGISNMTVKRALDYAGRWDGKASRDPYQELTQCPQRASRWRKR